MSEYEGKVLVTSQLDKGNEKEKFWVPKHHLKLFPYLKEVPSQRAKNAQKEDSKNG